MKRLRTVLAVLLCIAIIGGTPILGSTSSIYAPAQPAVVLKALGPQTINISWPKVSGAQRYIIYRSTGSGNPYAEVGSTDGTIYTDKTVYPNMNYFYKVSGVNGTNIVFTSTIKSIATPKKVYKDTDTAIFTNKFLESWVRNKLKKSANDKISIKDLDKITEIKFAGSTEITKDVNVNTDDIGTGGFGVKVNGKNTIAWDFYSLEDLMQFRKLDALYIMGQQVTDISPLANLSLTDLNLAANHISDINPLGGMLSLHNLTLRYNPIKDITALGKLAELGFLDLGSTDINSVSALSGLKNLNWLNLNYSKLRDVSPIGNIKGLSALAIRGVEYSDLSFMSKAKSIGFLEVSKLAQDQVKYLQQSGLKDINLVYHYAGDLTDLSLPKLERLEIYNSGFTDLNFIAGCSGIKFLKVDNAPVTDISALSKLKKLETIDLSRTAVADISVLRELPRLKALTLPVSATNSYGRIASDLKLKPQYCENGYYYYAGPYIPNLSAATDPKPPEFVFQQPRYISLEEVGTYDKSIITDQLKATAAPMPDASGSHIPYWTGTISESKISALEGWEPVPYWTEQDIKFIADNGMNYCRALLSFTFLSDPKDENKVSENAVKEIDQLIAWGMKYGVHIELSMIGLPNKWGKDRDAEDIGKAGGLLYFTSEKEQLMLQRYWTMLARRYADIPNKYLDFELYAEPNFFAAGEDGPEIYAKDAARLVNVIWKAEGSKSKDERRIIFAEIVFPGDASEKVAEAGCCIALHNSGVHRFCQGNSTQGFYENYPYLPANESWPVKYLPHHIMADDALTVKSESQFPQGTRISVYVMYDSPFTLQIASGSEVLMEQKGLSAWTKESNTIYSAVLKDASPELKIKNKLLNEQYGTIDYYQVTIDIPGMETIHLVPHTFGNIISIDEKQPVITISNDGTVTGSKMVTSDYIYETQFLPIQKIAQKYGVGFMLGETAEPNGVDTKSVYDFTDTLLKPLYENKIAWANGNLRTYTKPERKGAEVRNYEGTPWWYDYRLVEEIQKYCK